MDPGQLTCSRSSFPAVVGEGVRHRTVPLPPRPTPRAVSSRFFLCFGSNYNTDMILDDGHFVYSIDRGNALGLMAGQAKQLNQKYQISDIRYQVSGIRNLVLAGMGGSALAGEFIRNWLSDRLKLPFIICRDYSLPAFVGPDTLAFISSYSGNTEETLAAYEEAKKRSAQVVALSSGGKLSELAKADKLSCYQIPTGLQPRLAALFMVKALASALESAKLAQGISRELENESGWLEGVAARWIQEVPARDNLAKQLAEKLLGNTAVIYAVPTLASVAQRWKISLNENAKNTAFYNILPELNHNEFIGWLNPQTKPIKVIELHSPLDGARIAKRWEVTNRLLSGKMPSPIIVQAEGKTKLQQMLWTQLLGDFVGVYLGILNKSDPTPVDLVEKLKKELQ